MIKLNSKFRNSLLLIVFLAFSSGTVENQQMDKPRILVFFKTMGFKHQSIPFGITAIQKIGTEKGFDVDTTTKSSNFNDANLRKYKAVVFLSTTGNVLNAVQQAEFERYIQAGGGYVGIHAAADTEYDWPWYGMLAGGYFESHPNNPNVRKGTIDIVDKNHPSTASLPDQLDRSDEWYSYKSIYPGIKVLATLDEESYEGGTNGANHPISWYHDFDGGRAFYTGAGHTNETYTEQWFLQHLAGGIVYAIGDGKKLDYSKAHSQVMPEQSRFMKTVLVDNLNSPMELAVAPDGRVFFTEMLGNLSVYDTRTKKYSLVRKFPITNTGGTGTLGLTLDPNFASNNFLYIYYTPPGQTGETVEFYLSRFTVGKTNMLDVASEKVLLKVPVQRSGGSHQGGSLAFDKEGNLYLSTGDSSSPFYSNGYAPLDERPGAEFYSRDSQRDASNTNDFKGKVLRIHPEINGTYTIPEGNLFKKGTDKTKPEIYVMGLRNPYRIAVNPKSSVLYVADIGPDAGEDGIQGPRGYDELNQAKTASNFGWPYFIGNNFAYSHWDFAKNIAGPKFDPKAPINTSPNNTGLTNLPAASPAMIWYPYVASPEFPELGLGARCIIGGAFYTYNKDSSSPNRFPEYYNGALFIADWMRNWVFALKFDKNEDNFKSEPFMSANGDFRRPIDMAFGKDGIMYMLEYGSVYGVANADARLVKIEYNNGNTRPIAKAGIIDTAGASALNKNIFITSELKSPKNRKSIAGQAPLKVNFTSQGTHDIDENDKLIYEWMFDGKTVGAKTVDAVYTYKTPGAYKAILKVTDRAGLASRDTVIVKVGNSEPKVEITSVENKSFFWNGNSFRYEVRVSDRDEPSIDTKKVKVSYIYNSQPPASSSSVAAMTDLPGKAIMAASDCKSCHIIDKTAVGPSLIAIADRYKTEIGSVKSLSKKIISGGGGNWGKVNVMSAHPQISQDEAEDIVKYIFALTDKKREPITLASSGNIEFKDHKSNEPQGQYTIVASYSDKGGNIVGPLTATETIILRNANVKAVFADSIVGYPRFRNDLNPGGHKSYILLKNIDLTGIKSLTYRYASNNVKGTIEMRIDSKAGPIVSTVAYGETGSWDKFSDVRTQLSIPISGRHDVYFIALKPTKPNDSIIKFNSVQFDQ